MGGDDGAVDQDVFKVRLAGQPLEDAFEHARPYPTAKSLKDAVPVAELARQVTPGQAGADAPQHRFKEQPIVLGRYPAIRRLARQQGRDLLPDRVADNKPIPIHHRSSSTNTRPEAQSEPKGNP